VVPNIIGGSQGIETIGISNDESATNALVATVAGLAAWPPASIADTPIALTANSTGQYAVEACLVSEGFDLMDTNFVFEEQSGVLDALADGSVEYGGLWAPNLYLFLESSPGSHIVCSGLTGGAIIPGGIMIRNEFIQTEFGQTTALKALAAWMRGIEFIKNPDNRAQLLSYMETYYASYNVSISMSAMEQEIDLRPLYGLDEQLELMKRQNGAPSTVDGWYDKVSSFLLNNGVLTEIPEGSSYISDSYMAAIDADPELRAFATFGETSTSSAARVNESSLSKVTMYGVSVVGCVALAVL
jgi:NitT/TauT family transport system substrate-binding protein